MNFVHILVLYGIRERKSGGLIIATVLSIHLLSPSLSTNHLIANSENT